MNTFTRTAALFIALCWALPAQPGKAAEIAPIPEPQKVIMAPQSSRVQGEVQLTTVMRHGQSVLLLTLPAEAQDMALDLTAPAGKSIQSFSTENVTLTQMQGSLGKERAALQDRCDKVSAELTTIQAQMNVLSFPSMREQGPQTPGMPLDQRLSAIKEILPRLAVEKAQKERELQALQQRLATLPHEGARALSVIIDVPGLKEGNSATVQYAYTLPRSGWTPVYSFDAKPGEGVVHMRLMADVWQHSGVDWDKAKITLSTRNTWQRQPQPLRPWLVQKSRVEPRMEARMENPRAAAPMALSASRANVQPLLASEDSGAADMAAAPESFEDAALTGWILSRGLPEGRTRLPVMEEQWKTPVERLARPSKDNNVWLTAKYKWDKGALPTGDAIYLLEGSAVGTGPFALKNGEAELFFGADPLMSVRTIPDTRLMGKSGIVDKRQTWQWGWNYTVRNDRQQSVKVRLEEPAPQSAHKEVTVTLTDQPAATKGEENTLYWDVNVPAKGSASVRHEVRVSAPQNMELSPGR